MQGTMTRVYRCYQSESYRVSIDLLECVRQPLVDEERERERSAPRRCVRMFVCGAEAFTQARPVVDRL